MMFWVEALSVVFSSGSNGKLTNINLTNVG
jgi:hypothetical protein